MLLLLGCKWREALNHAINEKTLNDGKYGGLKGRDCTQVTLLEELRLDYLLLTRTPFGNFDNDATACYDRILAALSSLASQKYGVRPQVVFVHAATLEEAVYKLKLSTKVSEEGYKHCTVFPIAGNGQGSSNSPQVWIFISCVLFDVHESKAYMMKMVSPDKTLTVKLNMVGFVDDATTITGGDPSASVEKLLERIQHDAQLWYELLWLSGGNLELEKCGYHCIFYKFDDNDQPVMQRDVEGSIKLTTTNGTIVPIRQKKIYLHLRKT